jgi:hypothetical protein
MIKMILALLDERGLLTWIVSVDSTTVRAHQSAAGAGSRAVPGEPADHALGRSRGGWTTKLHLTADADGMRAMRPYVQEGIASRTLCLFDLNLSRTRRASHSFVHAACRNGFYG